MKDRLSARQLTAAAFTGLLAPGVFAAGMDWRGGVFALPVTLGAALCWRGLGEWTKKWGRAERIVLPIIYIVWLTALAGMTLASAGERITAPDGKGTGWAVVLIWIPVLLLARRKPAVFGRTAEIFYLVMVAALVMVLLFGVVRVKSERLLGGSGDIGRAFLTAAGTGCTGVAALLLWEGGEERPRWAAWSGALAAVLILMRLVTVGTLGVILAGEQERPFFTMTVGLGSTARVEGLVSAVWLFSDVTLLGLAAHCGKKLWRMVGVKSENLCVWLASLVILGVGMLLRKMGAKNVMQVLVPAVGILLGGVLPALACIREKAKGWSRGRKGGEEGGSLKKTQEK